MEKLIPLVRACYWKSDCKGSSGPQVPHTMSWGSTVVSDKATGLERMDMSILGPQLIFKPDSLPKELTATKNLHLNEARISAVWFQETYSLFQHKQQRYLTGFGSSGATISMLSQIMKITFYRVLNLVNTSVTAAWQKIQGTVSTTYPQDYLQLICKCSL